MTLATVPSERELVARATAGDGYALDELVRLHERRIAGLCRSRLRSSEDAADAVQETFARALSRLHQLKDPDAFGPWLRTIAVRVCADVGRELSRVSVGRLDGDTADDGPAPDQLAEDSEDRGQLHRALAGLGERDRRALWLRHGMEAPVSAVAAELGLTEGSTRVLLTRARHRLRAAASSLAALFPVSWRQWSRDHLAPLLQRPDLANAFVPLAAVASLVAVFPAQGTTSAADPVAPVHVETSVAVSVPEPTTTLEQREGAQRTTASVPATSAAVDEGTADAPQPRAPVGDVLDDVRVQEGYPEEEEYTFELRVISDEDAGAFRLYGDPLADPLAEPAAPVRASVRDSVGGLLGDD